MSIDFIKRIESCKWYAIPKKHINFQYFTEPFKDKDVYGDIEIRDNGDVWLFTSHTKTYPSATSEEIVEIENACGAKLPEDYRSFLLQTNGAELFIRPQGGKFANPFVCECEILSVKNLLANFQSIKEIAKEFWGVDSSELYYLPIAHVLNGNFIAISLNPDFLHELFFMSREYLCHPYTIEIRRSNCEAFGYVPVSTFSMWLDLVISSYGQFGLE